MEYIPTDQMVADGLTRPLKPGKFLRSRSTMGLAPSKDTATATGHGAGEQESMDIHPVGGLK